MEVAPQDRTVKALIANTHELHARIKDATQQLVLSDEDTEAYVHQNTLNRAFQDRARLLEQLDVDRILTQCVELFGDTGEGPLHQLDKGVNRLVSIFRNRGLIKHSAEALSMDQTEFANLITDSKAELRENLAPFIGLELNSHPSCSKAELRSITGLQDDALTKYCRAAGVVVPGRGKKNHKWTCYEVEQILHAIIKGGQQHDRDRAQQALADLKSTAGES